MSKRYPIVDKLTEAFSDWRRRRGISGKYESLTVDSLQKSHVN
jgi:hypothetical protein